MKQYLMSVIAAVLVGTVAELIPPDDDREGGRILRLFTGLMILCVAVSPLLSLLQAGPDALFGRIREAIEEIEVESETLGAQYAEQTAELIRRAGADDAGDAIEAMLAEQFGLPAEHCRAEVVLGGQGEEIVLERVTVVLSGSAVLADPYVIEAYLQAMFGGAAVVAME